jgi:hypothetical protein
MMQPEPFPIQLMPIAAMLLNGDPTRVERILKALSESPPSGDSSIFIENVLVGKDREQMVEIAQTAHFFHTLFNMRWSQVNPMTLERFAELIAATMFAIDVNLKASEQQLVEFKSLIVRTLNGDTPFGLTVKANRVLTQHHKNFIQSSIISDLRPVYSENHVTTQPLGALISHSLKIEYSEGQQRKEFYVGLDESELDEVAASITRAREKAESLRLIMKNSGVAYLAVTKPSDNKGGL